MKTETPYSYVRGYYNVPAYIGMRVRVRGREGELVKPRRFDQYIYIQFDGESKVRGPYHPTNEIEYLPVAEKGRV